METQGNLPSDPSAASREVAEIVFTGGDYHVPPQLWQAADLAEVDRILRDKDARLREQLGEAVLSKLTPATSSLVPDESDPQNSEFVWG